jgi:hypothetical protein
MSDVAEWGAVVTSAVAGMAGVGKTQLAIHAGHLLATDQPFDRVLFVDLRGYPVSHRRDHHHTQAETAVRSEGCW